MLKQCILMTALSLVLPLTASVAAEEKAPEETALQQIDEQITRADIDKSKSSWKENLSKPQLQSFDASKSSYWKLDTNIGDIKVKLLADVAPMHVTSTIYLTKLGFYDDVIFHRVISGFMAQGGDPTGTGRGGPGYKYAGEYDPKVKHD